MLTLQPQEINDIVNALFFKASALRGAASACIDLKSGQVCEELRTFHDHLQAEAERQEQLADKLQDEEVKQ